MNKTQQELHAVTKNRLVNHFNDRTTLTLADLQKILSGIETDFAALASTKKSQKLSNYWAGRRAQTIFRLECRDDGSVEDLLTYEEAAAALELKPQSLRVSLSRNNNVYSKLVQDKLYTLTKVLNNG